MAEFTSKVSSFGSGDMATQQAQLLRQQQLAQALAQQAGEPIQAPATPAGGLAVPVGAGAVLGKLAQGLAAGYMGNMVQKKEEDFNNQKQAKIADALGNYDKMRNGAPAQDVSIFGTDPSNPTTETMPAVKADPRGASLGLITSGVPELAQFGMQSFLAQKSPESMFGKVDPKDYTQASIAKFAQSQNFGDLEPVRKKEFLSTGGGHTAVDPYAANVGAVIKNTGDPYKDLLKMDDSGNLVQNSPLIEAKKAIQKAGAPNVNTTLSVAGPENQYNKDIGAGLAKDSLAMIDVAKAAPEMITNANMIRSALDKGAITGTGAENRLGLQKALETAGLVGKGKAASTEELMAGLGKLTLGGVKTSGLGAGNGFTDKDREFLNSAISGQITGTPENLRRVADLSERVARANYAKGQQIAQRFGQNPSLKNISADIMLDPLPSTNQSAPMPQQTPMQQAPKVRVYNPVTGGFQ